MADLIVALDVSTKAEVAAVMKRLGDSVDFYKIGLELFSAEGPDVLYRSGIQLPPRAANGRTRCLPGDLGRPLHGGRRLFRGQSNGLGQS